MRVLAAIYTFVTICLLLSCTPQGALTPRDGFYALRHAYTASDADVLYNLLSKNSIEKIELVTTGFTGMKDHQAASIAKAYGMPVKNLKSLTEKDFLRLHFKLDRKSGFMCNAVEHGILSIDTVEKKSVIRLESGIEFLFVKEGPYWKFEMDGL